MMILTIVLRTYSTLAEAASVTGRRELPSPERTSIATRLPPSGRGAPGLVGIIGSSPTHLGRQLAEELRGTQRRKAAIVAS